MNERGPKRIIVADRSFSIVFDTSTPKTIDVMKKVGQVDAVNQAISDVKAPVVAVDLKTPPRSLNCWAARMPRCGERSSPREPSIGPTGLSWPNCCSPWTT